MAEEQQLPQNIEAERAVLGAMLLKAEAIEEVVGKLSRESFYHLPHRILFEAMLALNARGQGVDVTTLTDELKQTNQLEAVGGLPYIMTIIRDIATTAHLSDHAGIVDEKHSLRRLIETVERVKTRAYEDAGDLDELVDEAERGIFEISQRRMRQDFVLLSSFIPGAVKNIEDINARQNYVTGLATGFTQFDEYTCGLQKQDLIIIAGRPSSGKSAFALDVARYAAVEKNLPVAVFSLEMSIEQLSLRLICAEARVNAHRVRSGLVTAMEWNPLYRAANRLLQAPIYLDDTPALSIMEVRSKARRLKNRHDIALLLIDYLQLMRGTVSRADNRQQEVAEISRFLKSLAKELDIPVIALSQLSRDIEKHGNRRPQLSDLRESGAIEQDADLVAFIWRQHQKNMAEGDEVVVEPSDQTSDALTELIIGKQRNGPTGTVKLIFVSDYMSFSNIDWSKRTVG
jgi:replicative DNA helicase